MEESRIGNSDMTEVKEYYDVVIIGGGINGTAIARDASSRGLTVLVLEKQNKLGLGASSNSSKLLHGGLRYLETGEFSLVKEALQERNLLLKQSPNLAKPLRFVFPFYKQGSRAAWKVKLGLKIYDWFASPSPLPKHDTINKLTLQDKYPLLKSNELLGACRYYDAQMDDLELVLANARSAKKFGATFIYPSTIHKLDPTSPLSSMTFADASGTCYTTKSPCFINVTGAWSNETLNSLMPESDKIVKASKGVHLVTDSFPYKDAFILEAPQDHRIFFYMPYQGKGLIGTTDTEFTGDPNKVTVKQTDKRYLIDAITHYFPSFKSNSIIEAFAGLRPLACSSKKAPSKRSRDMIIFEHTHGLISMIGGKYTTYRSMAEKIVDLVQKKCEAHGSGPFKPCITKTTPLDS